MNTFLELIDNLGRFNVSINLPGFACVELKKQKKVLSKLFIVFQILTLINFSGCSGKKEVISEKEALGVVKEWLMIEGQWLPVAETTVRIKKFREFKVLSFGQEITQANGNTIVPVSILVTGTGENPLNDGRWGNYVELTVFYLKKYHVFCDASSFDYKKGMFKWFYRNTLHVYFVKTAFGDRFFYEEGGGEIHVIHDNRLASGI